MARTVKKEPGYFGDFSDSEPPFYGDSLPLSDLEAFSDIFSGSMDDSQLFANFKEEDLFDYPSETEEVGMLQTDMGVEVKNEPSFEYESDNKDLYIDYNPYDSCDNADGYDFDDEGYSFEYNDCRSFDNFKSNDYDRYGASYNDESESGHESADSEVTLRLTPIVGGRSCPEALSKYQKRVYHERTQRAHHRYHSQEIQRQPPSRTEKLPKKDNLNRKRESEIYLELTKVLIGLQKVKPELQLFDSKLKSRQPSRLVTMQACRKLFSTHLISASKTKKKAMIMKQKFIKELMDMSAQNVDLRRAIELKISQCETIIRETSRVQP